MTPVSLTTEAWRRLCKAAIAEAERPALPENRELWRAAMATAGRVPPVSHEDPTYPLFFALERLAHGFELSPVPRRLRLAAALEAVARECLDVIAPEPGPQDPAAAAAAAFVRRLPYHDDTFDEEPRETGT